MWGRNKCGGGGALGSMSGTIFIPLRFKTVAANLQNRSELWSPFKNTSRCIMCGILQYVPQLNLSRSGHELIRRLRIRVSFKLLCFLQPQCHLINFTYILEDGYTTFTMRIFSISKRGVGSGGKETWLCRPSLQSQRSAA